MTATTKAISDYGVWWKFILATQLFYSFLLRVLLIIWSRNWIKRSLTSDIELQLQKQINTQKIIQKENITSVDIIDQLPDSLAINNWHEIPEKLLQKIPHLDLTAEQILMNDWQDSDTSKNSAMEQLLIVKAWEPPMGELEDYMKTNCGYLLPLDWNESGLKQLESNHLQEWQRFINQLDHWQLYLPVKGENL